MTKGTTSLAEHRASRRRRSKSIRPLSQVALNFLLTNLATTKMLFQVDGVELIEDNHDALSAFFLLLIAVPLEGICGIKRLYTLLHMTGIVEGKAIHGIFKERQLVAETLTQVWVARQSGHSYSVVEGAVSL